MKKYIILSVFCLLFVTSSYAENLNISINNSSVNNTSNEIIKGNGILKKELRELGKFQAINSSGAFEINIQAQKKQKFDIEAEENILPYILTEVKEETLFISLKKSINMTKSITISIKLKELHLITTIGTSNYIVTDLKNSSFILNSGGSGSVILKGKCDFSDFNLSGSGNLIAKDLISDSSNLIIKGTNKVDIYASKKLNIDVLGIADIIYYGDPQISKNIMGIIDIQKGK